MNPEKFAEIAIAGCKESGVNPPAILFDSIEQGSRVATAIDTESVRTFFTVRRRAVLARDRAFNGATAEDRDRYSRLHERSAV